MINSTPLHLINGSQAAANLSTIVLNLALQQQLEQTIKAVITKEFENSHILLNKNWNYLLDALYEKNQEAENLRQTTINQKETYLDIEALAAKFGVTKTTVHNWRDKKWIDGDKVGKQWFFKQSDIDELIRLSGKNYKI